jgi:PIN domain nuclease of toxin-antitoxin system
MEREGRQAVLKVLLDTHVVLWWVDDDRRLGREARRAIAAADFVWVSAASGWEVATKTSKHHLRVSESLRVTVAADNFTELPFTLKHAEELLLLPYHHRDPFDRILIAQARVEGATIVSHDRDLEPYGVPMIWT